MVYRSIKVVCGIGIQGFSMLSILKYIFYIENCYEGCKKHKIYYLFGIKIKIRVRLHKGPREFISYSRPRPIDNEINLPRKKVYISIAAIFKNEPDIIEWIEFHKLIGVERFYLYDNESDEIYENLLEPYIKDGTVVYKKVFGKCRQREVYCDAIYRYKNETEWLAIIDLDEYIVPVEKNDVKVFLKEYEAYPAVVVNWIMFDCNDVLKRPKNKTVLETYTRVYKNYNNPHNRVVKSIVRPTKVRYSNSVHVCLYKNNELAVDENFYKLKTPVYCQTVRNSVNKIRINHYHCKSCEDYYLKINKGFADQVKPRNIDKRNLYFKNTTQDFVAWKYLDELKQALNNIK